MLLHIMRLMKFNDLRVVDMTEIQQGSQRWITDTCHKLTYKGKPSVDSFIYVARKWLRFHNLISLPINTSDPTNTIVEEFVHYLEATRGMSHRTTRTYGSRTLQFLKWALARHDQISMISLTDVDNFLEIKRSEGCLPRTLGSFCGVFRCFFHYAKMRGWNQSGIAQGIHAPRSSRFSTSRKIMPWEVVRQLLNTDVLLTPANLRATAILFLCAIYGLRSSEAVNLTLDDFDWVNETFIVRRAKRGRVQQYPIQFEVGNIIIKYLKLGRPHSSFRNLFLTLRPPYRPVHPATLWIIFMRRTQRLKLDIKPFGAHSLRRACATELLRKGSSLRDIADFLGHRDLNSVSIYAKYDLDSLEEVASFSLGGLR